ncbi:hypothetical protein B0H14DRAFT_3680152 [Mycena olivaceomarginata]|nr:hypothetical protein B0H14DRAFT_3680152 [Mycena olivaceomarginata]
MFFYYFCFTVELIIALHHAHIPLSISSPTTQFSPRHPHSVAAWCSLVRLGSSKVRIPRSGSLSRIVKVVSRLALGTITSVKAGLSRVGRSGMGTLVSVLNDITINLVDLGLGIAIFVKISLAPYLAGLQRRQQIQFPVVSCRPSKMASLEVPKSGGLGRTPSVLPSTGSLEASRTSTSEENLASGSWTTLGPAATNLIQSTLGVWSEIALLKYLPLWRRSPDLAAVDSPIHYGVSVVPIGYVHPSPLDPRKFSWTSALGAGNFGSVFKVWDHRTRQYLAIKQLNKDTIQQEDLDNEILIHRLTDAIPGFPQLLGAFEDADNRFLVMECATISFVDIEVLVWGIIHRDIKHESLLLSTTGHLLVADFVIAVAEFAIARERDEIDPEKYPDWEEARLEGGDVLAGVPEQPRDFYTVLFDWTILLGLAGGFCFFWVSMASD